jgi:hypothetical protein
VDANGESTQIEVASVQGINPSVRMLNGFIQVKDLTAPHVVQALVIVHQSQGSLVVIGG